MDLQLLILRKAHELKRKELDQDKRNKVDHMLLLEVKFIRWRLTYFAFGLEPASNAKVE